MSTLKGSQQRMNILIVKLRHLGDTLLLTPTLRCIKERFPHAKIDVMVRASCEALLQSNPDVHRVFAIARPEAEQRTFYSAVSENLALLSGILSTQYDFAFDLSDSDRAKLWIWLSKAKIRGFRRSGLKPSWKQRIFNRFDDLPLSSEHQVVKDFETVTRIMGISGKAGPLRFVPRVDPQSLCEKFPWLSLPQPFVVLHATSRWSFKEWAEEHWAGVVDALHELGFTVVLSSGPAPREMQTVSCIQSLASAPTVSIAGAVSLDELAYILARARMFLGIDTFAMHLAAAMQTPTVALFGPSQLRAWTPWQNHAEIPLTHCQCDGSQYRACAQPVSKCLSSLSVAQVMESVQRLGVSSPKHET